MVLTSIGRWFESGSKNAFCFLLFYKKLGNSTDRYCLAFFAYQSKSFAFSTCKPENLLVTQKEGELGTTLPNVKIKINTFLLMSPWVYIVAG